MVLKFVFKVCLHLLSTEVNCRFFIFFFPNTCGVTSRSETVLMFLLSEITGFDLCESVNVLRARQASQVL